MHTGALTEAIARLADGHGGGVWITGDAGLGKTFLIDAALAQARARNCVVLRGAGDELMSAFPLRVLTGCLGVSRRSPDPARAELAALLRGDGAAELAADGMLRLVRQLCECGPVVLAADDLQWADEATLGLWPRLLDLADSYPLLLLGAARPVPARVSVAGLLAKLRHRRGQILTLEPVDDDATARIAAGFLGADPGPALRSELRRAGGNPGYVREMLSALADAGLVERIGETAEFRGEPGVTPAPLAASIDRGLRFLGDQTRAIIRVAAILTGDVAAAELAAVTGETPAVVEAAVAEAVSAGILLADDGGQVSFRHEVVRQALASQIPAAVAPALHQHTARALADGGRRLVSVARHMLVGPLVMDDWALRWLEQRSEASLYQVPRAAVGLLENAMQALDDADPRWEAFASKLAQASFWLGRDDGAFHMALEVARRTDDIDLACRMRIYAMRSAARAGRYADGISTGETALKAANLTDAWRARLGAWLAVLLLLSGQPRRGDARAFDALRFAALASDPLATAAAHQAVAHQAVALGSGAAAAVSHADMALAALGSDTESADLRLSLLSNRLIWLERLGETGELEQTLQVATAEAGRVSTFDSVGIWGAAAHIRYRQGRWEQALEYLDRIDPGFRDHERAIRLRVLEALIAVHRGQPTAAALDAVTRVVRPPAESMEPDENHYLIACALAAEADGDLRGALRAVAVWLEVPLEVRRRVARDDAPDLIRLMNAMGERGMAAEIADALEADASSDQVPGRVLAARCGRAQVTDDAEALLAVAAEYRSRDWPLRQGLALEEAAVRLARNGERDRAARALDEAVAAYQVPGASRDIRRAEARVRQHGVRRGPHSTHRTTDVGWAALTPAEEQVARLVADGRSNGDIAARLFISERTVRAHLSGILTKLRLRSRAELAAALAGRRGALPERAHLPAAGRLR